MSASANDIPIGADEHAGGFAGRVVSGIGIRITLEVLLYVSLAVM